LAPERDRAVGFSVRIDLAWMEQAAALVSLGRSSDEVRASLHQIIGDARASKPGKRKDSRTRTVNVISRVWVEPPDEMIGFRDRGVELLSQSGTREHLALHWGMTMATYPFFASVCGSIGRLLKLQDRVTSRDVHRRVAEEYGDRPTVVRATGVALGNCVEWGLLRTDTRRKSYWSDVRREVGQDVATFLVEAALHASGVNNASLDSLLHASALFPFRLPGLTAHDIDQSAGLQAMSLGGAEATVSLAR